MIKHSPIFDTKVVEDIYSKKDGVPIKYVCTSALGDESYAGDIFYRETPHPDFGNRYFQLFTQKMTGVHIRSADQIENLFFNTIWTEGGYRYSQHRHHYLSLGFVAIDGGRAYTRLVGNDLKSIPIVRFKVKDGKFVEDIG